MSSEESSEKEAEVVFVAEVVEESSEDPPQEEWSSLVFEAPEENVKKLRYAEGLYDPGIGELCAEYIAQSDSSVFRHLYYNYPSVLDPGIEKALLEPERPIIYPDDGQELYLSVCKEMSICPVHIFHKGLLTDVIDLSYYCVNPKSVRAMGMALKYNQFVSTFILLDNFLTDDACYHLADMLMSNSFLTELNLTGCRIGSQGTKILLTGLMENKKLKTLYLSRNQVGDAGMDHISQAVFKGMHLPNLYLRYNNIGAKSIPAFTEALETHNKFVVLDFSWNNLFSPGPVYTLLLRLSESNLLQELNLSWNSLTGARIGSGIKLLLISAVNLRKLDLSNNKLDTTALNDIIGGFTKAKKLVTINLSFNPLTAADALNVLLKMKLVAVKVQNIIMDNVIVNGEFLRVLQDVKKMRIRKNFTITYGGVKEKFVSKGVDVRELVLNRAEYLCTGKKSKVDIALIIYQMVKDKMFIMDSKEFSDALSAQRVPLDNDLIDEICNVFVGPKSGKGKTIDLTLLADYMHRKWPDRQLPPTPPPEPEPEPIPVPEVTDKKGKKAKK